MDPLVQSKELFFQALACQQQEDLDNAERLYRKALELAPGRASVLNNLAGVLLRLKRYAEAEILCNQLVDAAPADATAFLNLGNCRLGLRQPEAALAAYDRALAI